MTRTARSLDDLCNKVDILSRQIFALREDLAAPKPVHKPRAAKAVAPVNAAAKPRARVTKK